MTGEIERIAAEVERAEVESKGLFEEAFAACYPKPSDDCEPAWRPELPRQPIFHAWKTRQIAFGHFVHAGAWLDAAMTLVPEGADFTLDRITRAAFVPCNSSVLRKSGNAATPALALCAAALKARAHLEQHHAKD